jgi:hypothetical protein
MSAQPIHAGVDDELAERIVRLIKDIDAWIRALRKLVRPSNPAQRQLAALLADADRRMQILLMSEVMEKSDQVIVRAAAELAQTCRGLTRAIQGTRADVMTRVSVKGIAAAADQLLQLMLCASGVDPSTLPK